MSRQPERGPEIRMKPYVICLMHSSLDGRTHPSRWRPKGTGADWFENIHDELGVKRLLVEGGGVANGAFLRAGLIDEFNLILSPAIDGAKGAPFVFDSTEADGDRRAPLTAMTLESTRDLGGGVLLLRYLIRNDPQAVGK